MLDVTRLRVLHAVARHGSVTAAARELDYSQSSVSHHLARLEAETGACRRGDRHQAPQAATPCVRRDVWRTAGPTGSRRAAHRTHRGGPRWPSVHLSNGSPREAGWPPANLRGDLSCRDPVQADVVGAALARPP